MNDLVNSPFNRGGRAVRRLAIFIDGNYFAKVSDYYAFKHPRQARLNINGVHAFIRAEVAELEVVDVQSCQIVDSCYFRGRFPFQKAKDKNRLESDRRWDDVLMRAEVTTFMRHVENQPTGDVKESGIDVWLALEAYEMASLKRYDVCVLITGDGDFVPLVKKLNTLGSTVMLLGFADDQADKRDRPVVNYNLRKRVNHYVNLDQRLLKASEDDELMNGLFMHSVDEDANEHWPAEDRAMEQPVVDGEWVFGNVVRIDQEKYHGLVRSEFGGADIFFHGNDVLSGVNFRDIAIGDRLRYRLFRNPTKDRIQAGELSPWPEVD